jgi:hypothetical protein
MNKIPAQAELGRGTLEVADDVAFAVAVNKALGG